MTIYEREVKNLITPSFDGIRNIAYKQLMANFSRQEINGFYYKLERGTVVIGREELLWCYLYSFGNKHQAKICAALNTIKKLKEIVCAEYSIIDWGSGQGLATICMFDYLQKQGAPNAVKKIVLIEPSELALNNAVLHTSIYGVEEIVSVNKYLDDVTVEDIKTDTPVTIHLFSNILDVEGFSLKQLAQTIGASASGKHYFICVSPLYSNNHRIEAFYKYFAESDTIAYIEESGNEITVLASEQFDNTAEQNFTMQLLIFKYVSGKSYIIQIEYYPPVQFFGGAELDCIKKRRRSFSKEDAMRWSNMMAFEVAAPFDLGASVYDDVHPILAVLNNIVTRGLPTRTSPYIEDVFSCFGNELIYDELGGVEYASVLSDNEQVRMAQYYSPIGVVRIQKTVLEALMTGVLSIEQESWDVLVRERDVPCAAMAFVDLKNMFGHITSLSKDYQAMKLPEVRLTIICGDEWVDSPLHVGMEAQSIISEPTRNATYDIVVDVTVASKTDGGVNPFSEFKCKNNCYFTIRSVEKISSKRYIYTSDTIDYLALGVKNKFGELQESNNTKEHLAYFLKLLFRKKGFRPGQISILDRALQNKNVIGLLPTGGGKSLTYQFAAMMQPGVTVVIDPLRSLMKDQYDGLRNMGIDTCSFINSTLEAKERDRREKQLESSELQFIFLSPERLCIYKFREKLKTMHDMHVYFSYGVIDEVHCVSEWGHDFRFSYLHLGRNLYNYVWAKDESKRLTLFGLTATASFDVLSDVERELSGKGAYPLDAETIVRYENTDRLELHYKIERVPVDYPGDQYYDKNSRLDRDLPVAVNISDKWAAYKSKETILPAYIRSIPSSIAELQSSSSIERIKAAFAERQNIDDAFDCVALISDIPEDIFAKRDTYEQAGIVFCPHRKNTGISVGANASALSGSIRDVGTFTGGSDDEQDDKQSFDSFDRFRNNELPLMIATKAFGMGIDKPNVRFTVNMNYPSSLESFVQEAGRAGRDRRIALATILFSDYRLVRISKRYDNKDFPLALLRDKWFKEDDLRSVLGHYGIEIEPTFFDIFTPEHDLVKITCTRSNKMFAFQECSEDGCDDFVGCKLRSIPKEARGFHYYADLETVLTDAGMEVPQKDLQYLNPDYDTVIYFYNNNFKGDLVEKKNMHRLLSQSVVEVFIGDSAEHKPAETVKTSNLLEKVLSADVGTEIVAFITYSDDDDAPNNYSDVAKAIYRMCCIELIDDFTQDYARKRFRVVITRKPDGTYYDGLKNFLMRYYSAGRAADLLKDVPNYKGQNEIHKCLGYLTEFIYSKIAVKRKRAIDDMRLFCIQGLDDTKDWKEVSEDLKDFIYYYFNSKYANIDYVSDTGEPFSLTVDTDRGKVSSFAIVEKYMRVIDDDLVGGGGTPMDNLKHLQGAVRLIRRALTDNNPALVLLNFFCLVHLGINNNVTLENELLEDYQQGLLGFADRAESKEDYWHFFESFHVAIWSHPQQYDLSKLSGLKEEVIAKAHLAVLRGLKNKYCQQELERG
ncbi:DEAD/DEAH box helicase [Anoxynatronum sibiricum]|uniref:DEAD/DEAH box helicase n=2 Tax=Anoxynatronum sibiricum TaxID=210623 RepID=A0ABU9VTF4_9CLOT